MEIAEYNKLVDEGLSEYQTQCKVAIHLKSVYPDVLWTASAGGMRTSVGTGKKMKAAGYSKGCPDIFVFENRNGFAGLVIELKKYKGGQKSPEQIAWIEKLNQRGYKAVFCCGLNEAIKVIDDYFLIK